MCCIAVCPTHYRQFVLGYFVLVPSKQQREAMLEHERLDFAMREEIVARGGRDPGRTFPEVGSISETLRLARLGCADTQRRSRSSFTNMNTSQSKVAEFVFMCTTLRRTTRTCIYSTAPTVVPAPCYISKRLILPSWWRPSTACRPYFACKLRRVT